MILQERWLNQLGCAVLGFVVGCALIAALWYGWLKDFLRW